MTPPRNQGPIQSRADMAGAVARTDECSNLKAARIIVAVPVAPPDSLQAIRSYADEVFCLKTPEPFMAVGYWYRDFRQVSDAEVIELLEKARSL